ANNAPAIPAMTHISSASLFADVKRSVDTKPPRAAPESKSLQQSDFAGAMSSFLNNRGYPTCRSSMWDFGQLQPETYPSINAQRHHSRIRTKSAQVSPAQRLITVLCTHNGIKDGVILPLLRKY